MIEWELVAVIRELAGRGLGSKTIARTVGVARKTVRRYLRAPIEPGIQVRPAARRLTDDVRGRGADGRKSRNAARQTSLTVEAPWP